MLFLDELAEFSNKVIEVLRQPLEEKKININRLGGNYSFPADFMMVGAMNPCKCGYYPDRNKCKCSINEVRRYLGKISRPIVDRMDIFCSVEPVKYGELKSSNNGVTSSELKQCIVKCHEIQKERFCDMGINYNSQMTPMMVEKFCTLDDECKKLLEQAYIKFSFSARGYHKTLKIARTIADLDNSECIEERHVLEALCYRNNWIME